MSNKLARGGSVLAMLRVAVATLENLSRMKCVCAEKPKRLQSTLLQARLPMPVPTAPKERLM
jgi:hypothetical protein